MHLTIGMFGDLEFFKKFGKQGTENDLLIRNQAESGNVLTFVAPNSDRIQSLLQAIAMSDFPIVIINEITPEIGEILIALNESNFEKGLIITDFYEDKIKLMIKEMNIKDFDFVPKNENAVREKILGFSMDRPASPTLVTLDSYFPVKGVGTVILGLVKSGQVKQYDKLTVYPIKKEVLIKSMQSQDRDVKETEPGQRIGLALKGVESEELKRGYIFSNQDIPCTKNISLEAQKNQYSKFIFQEGKKIMVSLGLQVISGDIKSVKGNIISIELDNPLAIYQKICLIINPDGMPRIIGHGKIF